MKKSLIILLLSVFTSIVVFAQDEEAKQERKIPERMREYIQNKLGLSRNEAERFSPVFLRYFREFAQTHREFKGDRLILQQKIIELRLRFRPEFRQIMDEQRANKVFKYEDEFRQEAMKILRENRQDRTPPRRTRSVVLQ